MKVLLFAGALAMACPAVAQTTVTVDLDRLSNMAYCLGVVDEAAHDGVRQDWASMNSSFAQQRVREFDARRTALRDYVLFRFTASYEATLVAVTAEAKGSRQYEVCRADLKVDCAADAECRGGSTNRVGDRWIA